MLSFQIFCETMEQVSSTTSRNKKINLVAELIRNTMNEEELVVAVLFIEGRSLPEKGVKLGVGWRGLMSVVHELSGRSKKSMNQFYKENSDIGALVRFALAKPKPKLSEFFSTPEEPKDPLMLFDVAKTLKLISEVSQRDEKLSHLRSLLRRCSALEGEYIARIITSETRTGFRMSLNSISVAFDVPLSDVRRAFTLLGDSAEVAVLARRGVEDLHNVKLEIGRPVSPMLATLTTNMNDPLKDHNGESAIEPKIDGFRAVVHIDKQADLFKIFSRRNEDVTEAFPELKQPFQLIPKNSLVLDGEIMGEIDGNPIPFQDLSQRIRRKKSIDEYVESIPVVVWIFDILHIDGQTLDTHPYSERREILETIFSKESLEPIRLIPSTIVKSEEEAQKKFIEFVNQGHEGVVFKKLTSPYIAGKRRKLWMKYKPILELDLVITGAEWGHGRRTGWLSDYYLSAYDSEIGTYTCLGKTFKGLTDDEMKSITSELQEIKTNDHGWMIDVQPQIVVRVAFDGIQVSKRYTSGFALRFARITEIRSDKTVEEIDTLERVQEIFKNQRDRKANQE